MQQFRFLVIIQTVQYSNFSTLSHLMFGQNYKFKLQIRRIFKKNKDLTIVKMKISLYNVTTDKTILLESKKVVIGRDFFSVSTFYELFI